MILLCLILLLKLKVYKSNKTKGFYFIGIQGTKFFIHTIVFEGLSQFSD